MANPLLIAGKTIDFDEALLQRAVNAGLRLELAKALLKSPPGSRTRTTDSTAWTNAIREVSRAQFCRSRFKMFSTAR